MSRLVLDGKRFGELDGPRARAMRGIIERIARSGVESGSAAVLKSPLFRLRSELGESVDHARLRPHV